MVKKSTKETKAFSKGKEPYIATYVFYPNFAKGKLKRLFKKGTDNIEVKLAGKPIFLNKKHALDYSRFMDAASGGIFKLYVPQTAIVGCGQKLTLKDELVSKKHIHGCFAAAENDDVANYLKNPDFNEEFLSNHL